jgi:hypothetical protein
MLNWIVLARVGDLFDWQPIGVLKAVQGIFYGMNLQAFKKKQLLYDA